MKKNEIKENKKKRKLKWQVKLFLIILIIIFYAFLIGPSGIFIKEYKITSEKITSNKDGLKILQISDIHYGSTINEKDIIKIRKKANETKADIIIFTGDLISKNYKIDDEEKELLKKELKNIKAELGKYYVTGEEDFDEAKTILNYADFINLNNNPQSIYYEDNIPILLVDKSVDKNYIKASENSSYFKILALHNPDDFDKFKKYNFDIAIAGHTHNGQINIPKIKDLFISSKYKKTYQKINSTKLYINAGIGTNKIKIRLFNHPTMNLYRLNKTSTKNK